MYTGHYRKNILKDGKTAYQLVVEGPRDPITGKRDRHYKTIRGNKKQADIALRNMISEYENGNVLIPSVAKLSSWLETWLNLYCINLAETTKAGYKEKINNCILPYLKDITLNSLNANIVQSWVNKLVDNNSAPKTIRNAYNILNASLKKAVILDMIQKNPCFGIELPKLQKPKTDVYNSDEIHTVLKVAENTDMYLILLLFLTVGMRRGELAALRWENVDLEQKKITICENRVHGEGRVITKAPKTIAGIRTISIGDDVIAELKKAKIQYFEDKMKYGMGFQDLGFVVRKEDGTPYHPDSLTQKWERFTQAHGIKHIRLHDLRHTCATMMISSGVSAKVVQERLGHSNVNTTLNIYTHVLPKMDEDAAKKLDEIIFTNVV